MRPLLLLLALVAAPAAANDGTPTTAKPPATKVICRASVETGSLVKKRRSCWTQAEWDRLGESHRNAARKMVEDNTSLLSTN